MPRLSPALARARLARNVPGRCGSGFGFGRRVMAGMFSFSSTMMSLPRTKRVLTFSAQSLRRPATWAAMRAIACLVPSRLREPLCCRDMRRCNTRYRAALRSLIRGAR